MPERRRRPLEFDAHLRPPGLRVTHVNHAAIERLLARRIRHTNRLSRHHRRSQTDQRAVRVHHQRARLLREILSSLILARHRNRHAQQDAHAAAPSRIGNPVLFLGFCRAGKSHDNPTIGVPAVRGNRTKVQPFPGSVRGRILLIHNDLAALSRLADVGGGVVRGVLNESTGGKRLRVLPVFCAAKLLGLEPPQCVSSGRFFLSPASRSAWHFSCRPPVSRA